MFSIFHNQIVSPIFYILEACINHNLYTLESTTFLDYEDNIVDKKTMIFSKV